MMTARVGNCNRCNPKGFRFKPTDEELVNDHLRPKILSPQSHQHYINDIRDLSQFEPQDLFRMTQKDPDDKEGYFFWWPTYKNERISRKSKNGYWSETCSRVQVTAEGGGEEVAERRMFVFCEGVYPGIRTSWIIHQLKLTASLPDQQNHEEIFLCKLFKQKDEKDRVSGKKRKDQSNVPETAERRGAKDRSSRKKAAKVSSTEEAELGQKDLASGVKNSIISCDELHGIPSLPSDPGTNILIGDKTPPQSHHMPSKDDCQNLFNNMHKGGHSRSNDRLHRIYGTLCDPPDSKDNQQSYHLPSNSIINTSFSDEMHHFRSNMCEDNRDARYKAWSNDGSQLSCHMPSVLKNDDINSEGFQISHHLPSNLKESIVNYDAYEETQSKQHDSSQLKDHGFDYMERDSSCHSEEFNIQEVLAALPQEPQAPMSSEVQSGNEFPPSSDINSNADKFRNQLVNREQNDDAYSWNSPSLFTDQLDDANFWNSLLTDDTQKYLREQNTQV